MRNCSICRRWGISETLVCGDGAAIFCDGAAIFYFTATVPGWKVRQECQNSW